MGRLASDQHRERKAVLQEITTRLQALFDEAKLNQFEMLAYLIDIALLEAKDLSRSSVDKSTDSD